jgi:hypothetical protein
MVNSVHAENEKGCLMDNNHMDCLTGRMASVTLYRSNRYELSVI